MILVRSGFSKLAEIADALQSQFLMQVGEDGAVVLRCDTESLTTKIAILENGEVAMLIECKHHNQNLGKHNSQLFRYFATTKTRFAMLTNGIKFQFFSDIKAQNIMDEKPFFEFDIRQISDFEIDMLEWFHKDYFDINKVFAEAKLMKYDKELKELIRSELSNPSPEFIKFWINKVYNGKLTEKALKEFTPIVEKAIKEVKAI